MTALARTTAGAELRASGIAGVGAAALAGIADAPGPQERAASLLARARMLRKLARKVQPVVADAYARRAAELTMEAWARAVRTGPVSIDDVVRAAHAA